MSTNKYIALIPAYKPTCFLADLVKKLVEFGFSVVVVDDGSGYEYAELFSECEKYAEILQHIDNSGKGCAIKTGLAYIGQRCDEEYIVVTIDADGQHKVEDALALVQIAEKNPHSLILGSRKLKESVPFRSRLGNTITRYVYRLSTGVAVHDTQTGLRAFGREMIPMLLAVQGERYEYEMNVLLRFACDKIKIIEHEIETIYLDGNSSSHFDSVKDSFRIYREILKFSVSSFAGFLVDYSAYSLLALFTNNLLLSNVIARIISACVNFLLNRKFVFKSRENLVKLALKYFLLAAGILFGNTLVLGFLADVCGVHHMIAKIMTEAIFYLLSWSVQSFVIFKKRNGGGR